MDFSSASFGLSLTGALGLASLIAYRIVKHGLKSKCMVSGMSISLDVHQSSLPPPETPDRKEQLKVHTEQVVLQVLEQQSKSNTTTPTSNKNKNSVDIV